MLNFKKSDITEIYSLTVFPNPALQIHSLLFGPHSVFLTDVNMTYFLFLFTQAPLPALPFSSLLLPSPFPALPQPVVSAQVTDTLKSSLSFLNWWLVSSGRKSGGPAYFCCQYTTFLVKLFSWQERFLSSMFCRDF